MPRRKEIQNTVNTNLMNVQVNPEHYTFDPNQLFEKWAVVPVENFDEIPNEMETLVIKKGLYAVFQFKGDHTTVAQFFNQIYTVWLPSSGFQLDNRPQFEILGEKYKVNDPNSEEEIWIPIKK
jgi:AraC family transcriptional regulator